MPIVNLLSDTVTKPTQGMLEAMFRAEVGDDVFREDPTVNALEAKCAALFGHEAALFCPSGTMTNQIALKVHTRPLDEVICDEMSHIYQYEVGGYAFHSGISVNLLKGENGILTPELVDAAVKPRQDWLPKSSLVVIENTCNKGGGSIYPPERIRAIRAVCKKHDLALHLDGARIFNALVETGDTPASVGAEVDSLSICLSKGLGTPVGSVLMGNQAFIAEARRVRKVMGGGMRQAGYLAAAGIYALDHHVERLKEDHIHARLLASALAELPYVANIRPVQTNIVIFDLVAPVPAASTADPARLSAAKAAGTTPAAFLDYLKRNGVIASAFGPQTIRFVTHLDVKREMVERAVEVLRGF
ncbi:MAG: aminotransferase class I/II-fold pyridoxal phosphate-dependent enzyme [Haliscomenobacteraceae bacterium CHB4]|nr:L-allo-threonine aldolase [Saprospiraceae bacterium]MCE7925194.1 aminotransferase class I/II-fold pyridoxal phosphate-dependent enzyme [Haliscomenobacteraceae bacterium CHB4]